MFVGGGRHSFFETYNGRRNGWQQTIQLGFSLFFQKFRLKYKNTFSSVESVTADTFELLCTDGTRKPLSEYRQCNWGLVPSHALVVSSARTTEERKRYQRFMLKAVQLYSHSQIVNATGNDRRYEGFNRFDTNQNDDKYYDQAKLNNVNQNPNDRFNFRYDQRPRGNLDSGFTTTERPTLPNGEYDNTTKPYEKFDLFESKRYGGRLNLMFQDSARTLVPIKENDQSYAGYLGQSLGQILGIRQCPVGRMTFCVTSDMEMEKCVKMRVR